MTLLQAGNLQRLLFKGCQATLNKIHLRDSMFDRLLAPTCSPTLWLKPLQFLSVRNADIRSLNGWENVQSAWPGTVL